MIIFGSKPVMGSKQVLSDVFHQDDPSSPAPIDDGPSLITRHSKIQNPKSKIQNQSPLSMAVAGQELRLVEIQAGRRLAHRLAELGLTPGVTLRVVQKNGGPLLISVRGSRIAIGRGLAHKLLVTPVG